MDIYFSSSALWIWDWWHMGNYISYAAVMDRIFIFEHTLSREVWL